MRLMRWQPSRRWVSGQRPRNLNEFSSFDPFWVEETQPPIDMLQTPEDIIVKASLPGVKLEDLDIHVTDNLLTINAEHQESSQTTGSVYHRQELRYGHFSRTVELPAAVNAQKAEATLQHGELLLKLPVSGEQQSRKITIKTKRTVKIAGR